MGYLTTTPSKVPFVKALMGAAALALLGVLALGVPSASAQAGGFVPSGVDDAYGEAVCIVKGAAGTAASPVDGPVHDGADDDEAVGGPPVALNDTDGGVFDFSTEPAEAPDALVVCAGTDQGGATVGSVADSDMEITAGTTSSLEEGEYTNLITGTGHAEGSADLVGGAASPGTDLLTRFSIDFVGGTGPLAIGSFDGVVDLTTIFPPPIGEGTLDPQDIDTGHGVGAVEITAGPRPAAAPNATDCNPPDGDPGATVGGPADFDVGGFLVEAAFTATLSGDADVPGNENDDPPDAVPPPEPC